MNIKDYPAALAIFLTEKTGSPLGQWSGRLTASEQRALLGRYIGKGRIVINGTAQTVSNRVRATFGRDWDDRNVTPWHALNH